MVDKKATSKIERGILYIADERGDPIDVRPADGKKFTYEEQKLAVGGYIEMMVPTIRGRQVYVNEEGALQRLAPNRHTWTFANRDTYVVFNGYAQNWKVAGNALEVYKCHPAQAKPSPTIAEVLRTLKGGRQ